MRFMDYQVSARKTAIYPNRGENLVYPVLGLNGEAGEVAEKVKKLIRDNESKFDKKFSDDMVKELGDVLWYVAAICDEMGFSMATIAQTNIKKLNDRSIRNKLSGSGDNR
ncbi:nucleoside triphosphate pyrophosphohydrolase family protein [bacterium]|nr:nucleoside triphosphate pyrophosphohydrolase family protein [bacterium]